MNPQRSKLVATFLASVCAALVLGACATVGPRPIALEDARLAVDSARTNPQVTTYASAELNDAIAAYVKAEKLYSTEGDTAEVRHQSYVARQRAALAQETASLRQAERVIASSASERERIRLEARAAEAEAASRRAQVAELRADSARRAAVEAEQQAAAAQRQAQLSQQEASSAQEEARSIERRNAMLEAQLRELAATKSDRGLVITMNDVLFDSGSAALRPGGRRLVARLSEFLREYPERTLAVEGFTDSVGDDLHNQQLSERRAAAVQIAMMEEGIDGSRILVRGYGEAFPVASNDTAEGRQRNRRVEVVISDGRVAITPRVATYVVPLR
jgi:outer membrane protein OmpA-like peptidoglycan-associated protein